MSGPIAGRPAGVCPLWERMVNYFLSELPEDQMAVVDEHFATCDLCIDSARAAHEHALALENWTPRAHGEAWKRELVGRAFAAARADATLGERVRAWGRSLRSATAGAVEVLVEASGARLVTTGLSDLVRADGWRFEAAYAARKTPGRIYDEARTSSGLTITVREGKAEVSAPSWPQDEDLPVLLIAVEEGDDASVLVPLVRERSGRVYAVFDAPRQSYLVLFLSGKS